MNPRELLERHEAAAVRQLKTHGRRLVADLRSPSALGDAASSDVRELIRKRPRSSVGGAAAAGFLLAPHLRRRRTRRKSEGTDQVARLTLVGQALALTRLVDSIARVLGVGFPSPLRATADRTPEPDSHPGEHVESA